MKSFFLLLLAGLPLLSMAQKDQSLVVIGTRDSIYSPSLKEMRHYMVHLPRQYNNSNIQPEKYPVLYLLDGDAHFNAVSGMVEILGGDINGVHVIPDMIVVAIPNTDRTRDLSPTHTLKDDHGKEQDFFRTSGGNDIFFKFLKDELIPHIDASYRTMPYRMFVGHSLGGLTVINALYTIPETFNAYVAIDPSLWWDNRLLVQKAKQYFQQANLKGKALYIGQANTTIADDTETNEHFEAIKEFATLLQTRNRSALQWKYDYYSDDDHSSVTFISEYNAFRFIFDEYHIRFNNIFYHPDKLKSQFEKFSDETSVKFMPPESYINDLGYDMLNTGKFDLALKYFQMNVDNYPESANAYDSYAETWMKMGDNEKAIVYYKKSLSLNANNQNAKKMIAKMQSEKKGSN